MPAFIGKRIVLPSSFTGGPRYMAQNFQDATAICRWADNPYLSHICSLHLCQIQNESKMARSKKAS